MSNFGWHSGYLEALNVQAGTLDMTGGQTTASVTFDGPMRGTPSVLLTNSEDDLVFHSTRSQTGFTAERGSTGAAITVSWMAMDDAAN